MSSHTHICFILDVFGVGIYLTNIIFIDPEAFMLQLLNVSVNLVAAAMEGVGLCAVRGERGPGQVLRGQGGTQPPALVGRAPQGSARLPPGHHVDPIGPRRGGGVGARRRQLEDPPQAHQVLVSARHQASI